MSIEHERLKEILAEAVGKETAEARAGYLEAACQGNAELRAEVEKLLRAHELAGDFLESALLPPPEEIVGEAPGTVISHYKLLEQIGEGGFGVVFMAEQIEPIRRRVALKIVKPGMDSKQVIARFEAERQALALMDHPNIARIYDAGATRKGRPYFAMELVPGVPITSFCDANQLTPAERLRLFMTVCEAVQHAHQKGIIHRDLKPSNILVTLHDGKPVPKIIDFGTAKALQHPLTGKTLFTAYGRLIGTPQYMSPEQAELSGLDVDTRADIYSLGVLLYELLTGTTPFEAERLRAAAFEEMMRIIHREEPPKPSTRVSTLRERATEIAGHRQLDPAVLRRTLRGDLDWIVMKALEKDRSRRYATAGSLLEDIQRHLDHEPVQAGPPGALYRAGKFVRRHRLGVMSAVTVGLALGLGFTVAMLALVRAERQRHRAEDLLRRMQVQRTQEAFASDQAIEGLANLAEIVRNNPGNFALTEWLLNEMTQRTFPLPVIEPLAHDAEVLSAAFSPDGSRILTVARNNSARLWDTVSGQCLFAPARHDRPPETAGKATGGLYPMFAVFSPEGSRFATGANDHTARLWDARTGEPLVSPLAHPDWVTALAFSPDGTLLATGCKEGSVRFWNPTNGHPAGAVLRHSKWVNFVCFGPDGKRLLTGSDDGTAQVWEVASGRRVGTPLRHAHWVKHGCFSFDGRRVATASSDGTARLWNADTGQALSSPLIHRHTVVNAIFSPDGTRLATASFDRTARLWDGFTGRPLTEPLPHKFVVRSAQFSPEGERLVTASEDGTARVWDALTGEPLGEPMGHQGIVWYAAFSPDGRHVVTCSSDRSARLWDVQSAQPFHHRFEHFSALHSALWIPESRKILTLSSSAKIWDWLTAVPVSSPAYKRDSDGETVTLSPDGKRFATSGALARIWWVDHGKLAARPLKHLAFVQSVQFSRDGQWVATASDDGTARVWKTLTGEPAGPPLVHEKSVYAAEFSPDGQRLLTGGADAKVRLWDWRTGRELAAALPHPDSVSFIEFSPDGLRALTKCLDFSVRVWDLSSGQMLGRPIRHLAAIESAAFSPDGRWIVTASADQTARVWEANTGKPVSQPLEHDGRVTAAEFSPDGRRVLTASHDLTARVWDALTGMPVSEPLRHSGRVTSAHFSPDGLRILTGSYDRTARIWEIMRAETPAPPWLPDLAEAVAGQRITSQGSREHVPVSILIQLRAQIDELSDDLPLARWAKWFCAKRSSRATLPSTSQSRDAFIRQLIERPRPSPGEAEIHRDNLREARVLDPLNPEVYCAWVERLVPAPVAGNSNELGQLDWQTRRIEALATNAYTRCLKRSAYHSASGDVQGALALADEALRHLERSPDPSYYIHRAAVLERAGRLDEALENLSRGVELEQTGGHPARSCLWSRHSFLCRRGRLAEAHADWLKATGVLPRAPETPLHLVDLSMFFNEVLTWPWQSVDRRLPSEQHRASLSALPRGVVKFDGIEFDVRGVIRLRATNQFRPYGFAAPQPDSMPVPAQCRRFHFLHAADRADISGKEIGAYILHYAGGQTERIPIIYGQTVSCWVLDSPDPGGPVPVWHSTRPPGITIQLFHSVWTNALPDRVMEGLEFTASPSAEAAPFLVALTAEP